MTRLDDRFARCGRKLSPKLDNVIIKCLTMLPLPLPLLCSPLYSLFFLCNSSLSTFSFNAFFCCFLFSTWEFFTRQHKRGLRLPIYLSLTPTLCLIESGGLFYRTRGSSSYCHALSTSFQFVFEEDGEGVSRGFQFRLIEFLFYCCFLPLFL